VKDAVEARYPGLTVLGGHYPASAFAVTLSRAVMFAQVMLACVTLLDFDALGVSLERAPALVLELRNTKTQALLMIWVVGNMIHANAMNTGAFEVYYGGSTVFSKVESKTLPSFDAIFRGVDALRGGSS
jgi:thioredoxin reductase-like selenoprotein T